MTTTTLPAAVTEEKGTTNAEGPTATNGAVDMGYVPIRATQLARLLDAVTSALNDERNAPCSRKKGDMNCTQQFDGIDDDGRAVVYYAVGCEAVKNFCPACRAYWLVATARNAIFDMERVSR